MNVSNLSNNAKVPSAGNNYRNIQQLAINFQKSLSIFRKDNLDEPNSFVVNKKFKKLLHKYSSRIFKKFIDFKRRNLYQILTFQSVLETRITTVLSFSLQIISFNCIYNHAHNTCVNKFILN